jgi:hypothetical protein
MLRDDLKRAGGQPKNHARANKEHLKKIQAENQKKKLVVTIT